MEYAKEQKPTHLSMAEEVADKVINEFGSKDQHEFLQTLKQKIDMDYQCKIKECTHNLESLKGNYENFLGNPDKSAQL